jgi:hypothetical protein
MLRLARWAKPEQFSWFGERTRHTSGIRWGEPIGLRFKQDSTRRGRSRRRETKARVVPILPLHRSCQGALGTTGASAFGHSFNPALHSRGENSQHWDVSAVWMALIP